MIACMGSSHYRWEAQEAQESGREALPSPVLDFAREFPLSWPWPNQL